MNLVNRALIIIFLVLSILFWGALVALVLLAPDQILETVKNLANFVEANLTLYTQLMFALLGAILIVASILLLIIELTPRGPEAVQLTQTGGGVTYVTIDAIVQRIKYDLQAIPQIHRSDPKVLPRSKQVDIKLDLRTTPDSVISETSEEAARVVRDSVENKMGVKIRKLTVHIHHEPIKGRYQPEAKPAEPPKHELVNPAADSEKNAEETKNA